MLSARLWLHLLVVRPLLHLVFGINVEGKENLSELGQYILVANHNSHLDILLLFDLLPFEHILRTRPVAAEDYFAARPVLYRLVNFLFRPIWIVRGEAREQALQSMSAALDIGDNVILFPEGTRGVAGRIGRFKTGIGRLAERHRRVPTVPVFLSGPERALPKGSAVPVPMWNRITVGPPQIFEEGALDFTAAIERMIRELSESATANRHRRVKRSRSLFTIAILGIDGSGKSTVSRTVAEEISRTQRVCRISDGIEFYERGERHSVGFLPAERLRRGLGHYAKTAKSLKRYKIPKLAELLLRDRLMNELHRWYAPEFIVLDGSPLINLAAWAKLYKGDSFDEAMCASALRILTGQQASGSEAGRVHSELPELAALTRFGLARLTLPGAVVFLNVEPALCVERIRRRGERMQVHETEEKLARLSGGYRMVCNVVEKQFRVPFRILEASLDLDQITASALAFLDAARKGEHPHGTTSD